jgi:hypothetical protein
MEVVPRATDVASPWLPALLLTVATAMAEDAQLARVVMSLVVPSE